MKHPKKSERKCCSKRMDPFHIHIIPDNEKATIKIEYRCTCCGGKYTVVDDIPKDKK